MLSVSTLSELTTQCATRYYGPRTHSPATRIEVQLLLRLHWKSRKFELSGLLSDPSLSEERGASAITSSAPTTLGHAEVSPCPCQPDPPPSRYITRLHTAGALQRLNYASLSGDVHHVDDEFVGEPSHWCGVTLDDDEEEPSSYNAAMNHPTASGEWAKACKSEWLSWKQNDCYDVLSMEDLERMELKFMANTPPNSVYVFRIKRDHENEI